MIILGVALLVLSVLVPQTAGLWTVGIILIVIGVLFAILGFAGRPVGGRRNWF